MEFSRKDQGLGGPPDLSKTSHILRHLRIFWKFLFSNMIEPGALIYLLYRRTSGKRLRWEDEEWGEGAGEGHLATARGGAGGSSLGGSRVRVGLGEQKAEPAPWETLSL